METSSYKVVRLTQEYAPKSFNCGDQDLNEFLLDNAKAYLKELFAINQPYQHQGFGQIVIDILKQSFTQNNRTGCKYLTVDAYRSATPFYEKNGFKYLSESDKDAETRLMYFDLIQLMED